MISVTWSGVTCPRAFRSSSMAGGWSHMPMQFAHSTVNSPSAVVPPNGTPSSTLSRSATWRVPAISQLSVRHVIHLCRTLSCEMAGTRHVAEHLDRGDAQPVRDDLHGDVSDLVTLHVQLLKDRDQRAAVPAVLGHQRVDGLDQVRVLHGEVRRQGQHVDSSVERALASTNVPRAVYSVCSRWWLVCPHGPSVRNSP